MTFYSHAAEAVPEQTWWIGRQRFGAECADCGVEIGPDDSAYFEPDGEFEDGQWYDRSTWLCAECGRQG